ncbi:unnamed protein product [Calypogeia fissa]
MKNVQTPKACVPRRRLVPKYQEPVGGRSGSSGRQKSQSEAEGVKKSFSLEYLECLINGLDVRWSCCPSDLYWRFSTL